MKFQGFIGPSYTLNSVNVDCQRSVNLYPELIESGSGKEAQVAYLRGTPGLTNILELGDGPIRLIHVDTPPSSDLNNPTRVFVVSGSKLFRLEYDGSTWSTLELQYLGGPPFSASTGPVRAASLNIDLGTTVFVDGNSVLIYERELTSPTTFNETLDAPAYGSTAIVATHVVLIDGYLIFNEKDTGQFWVSNWNSFAVDPLSFASAEGDPDKIVSMIANNRYLWLFNEKTTEVFANTGNADFPFERVSGGFIEKGCVAAASVAKIDGTIFWLGRDESGEGIVYAAQGLSPQRISTHAIEQAIRGYEDTTSAIAYTYQNEGHSFYVLNFAEGTWVYDLSTKLWHERGFTGETEIERHRANNHGFISQYGLHILGDYSNNKIYQFGENVYKDDETEITRLRTFPHSSAGGKRVFHNRLQIDMETGVGLDGGVQGSDPQVMLQFSDDGGHTWSDEDWASAGNAIGAIGDYKKRVAWRRLGSSYDRVYRLKITDPVKVVLLSADIDLQVGGS